MRKNSKLLGVLFVIYIILLIWIIMFRLSFSISSIHRVREINLIPFNYGVVHAGDIPIFETLLNILIFLPFGIYLKMFGFDNKKIVFTGFWVSLLFEVSQYIFRLGSSDITDIIANTLGMVVGIFLYFIFRKIFKNDDRVNKIFLVLATIVSVIMVVFFFWLLIGSIA